MYSGKNLGSTREPRWKSLIATTVEPVFTPQQCQDIINVGHQQKPQVARTTAELQHAKVDESYAKYDTKKRNTTISWIPFKVVPEMYKRIEMVMMAINRNHFGYEGMTTTELAQFTEYPKGGFFEWHIDAEINCQFEPPVRKISMTILLSDASEFEGGDLEFMTADNNPPQLIQGQAIFFNSMIRHRVTEVKKGMRRSLVMWFGGTPFK